MKKLLLFAAIVAAFAIGSGGHISMVHAQSDTSTLTPSETAALQQQLDVAKATLANLEMQAGVAPAGDSGMANTATAPATTGAPTAMTSPSASVGTGLSANQIAAFQGTLTQLTATLSQLDQSLATNATLNAAQQQAIESTLGGMSNTLVAMANTISAANAGTSPVASAPASTNGNGGVAMTSPSANIAPSTNVAPSVTAPAPSTPSVAAQQTALPSAPQTAQASSIWSFTKDHWPTIVIVLLIIAILFILFWPEKEGVRTVSPSNSQPNKPKTIVTSTSSSTISSTSSPSVSASTVSSPAPAKPAMSANTATATASASVPAAHPAPATPVANAVAAPAQRMDTPTISVARPAQSR